MYSQQPADSVVQYGLQSEIMLHPADAYTGYVLKKGECIYNQALTPYPSWAWWGLTNWLTTELDLECWIGGVPSVNFRISLLQQNKYRPAISYESMFQYLRYIKPTTTNLC